MPLHLVIQNQWQLTLLKFPVSDTHWAKTWLLDERAPELTKPEGIQDLHDKMVKIYAKEGGA